MKGIIVSPRFAGQPARPLTILTQKKAGPLAKIPAIGHLQKSDGLITSQCSSLRFGHQALQAGHRLLFAAPPYHSLRKRIGLPTYNPGEDTSFKTSDPPPIRVFGHSFTLSMTVALMPRKHSSPITTNPAKATRGERKQCLPIRVSCATVQPRFNVVFGSITAWASTQHPGYITDPSPIVAALSTQEVE